MEPVDPAQDPAAPPAAAPSDPPIAAAGVTPPASAAPAPAPGAEAAAVAGGAGAIAGAAAVGVAGGPAAGGPAAAGVAGVAGVGAGGAAVAGTASPEEERRRRRRLAILLFLLLLLITLLTLTSLWYLMFRRPLTDLLPPVGQNDPPHYMFSVYGASKPVGVAVTGAGDRIYVTESSGDRVVRVFDGAGQAVGTLLPPTDGLPHTPVYAAVDPRDGDVYVTDRATGAIYVYDSSNRYLRSFKPQQPIDNWQPLGVALSPAGDWWVSDLGAPGHRVEVFAWDGTLKQTVGQGFQLDYPNGIAFDTSGNAYVTDSNNGRLLVLDSTGQLLATIGRGSAPGNLGLPRGIAGDDTGRLYVVDATGQFVHMYRVGTTTDWRPTYLAEFGSQGINDGQFEFPNGIATDSRYRIYVTDRENNRVQVWGY